MKNAIIYSFAIFLISACANRIANDKFLIIQSCLNKMHENVNYNYLEQSNLILVKNKYTYNLTKLHFGTKKLLPIDVAAGNIKLYGSAKDVVGNKRHLVISSLSLNNGSATVIIELANVNQTIEFGLIKKNLKWEVVRVHSWIS